MLSLTHYRRDLEQKFCALLRIDIPPALKSLGRGVDRLFNKASVRVALGKDADNLALVSRVVAVEFRVEFYLFAVYNDRILAAEFGADLLDRGTHRVGILGL